ncbi:KAP family P-loop NTPase fold protein [Enterobacter kobei]|uniref:KAP family P-loop NTPase fold protein n=1 Tax=Enterobacter kobei TaxID=208224 RepID=UPI0012540DDD|nr:P-loop NTPase fold protein [Enterobacter kobei]MBT1905105.1 KAP family NTPase [Enterobacter kobei]VAL06828.1 Predicted P-loop ATPase [Enterobacter kobei]
MDIEWNWDQANSFLNENLPADTLDRQRYGKHLYEVCIAHGKTSNLVININAGWGAGKTYFTKRLAQTISTTHATVYIDAWKEDFSDDPLLTVFSSIKEQLTGQSDKFTTLLNKTISNLGPLLKTATPILLEGLIKKYTGVESLSDLTKDLSAKLLDLHSEKANKIASIKNGISEWVRYIEQQDGIDKQLPLFIIIDELDRCRPDYAISLLEITKHIFNIPGVIFIISTDTEQLQHSIKVVYGSEFSASHYLNRFFDRRFLLPTPKMAEFLTTLCQGDFSENFDQYKDKFSPCPPDINKFIYNCASILQVLNINLRDSIKIFNRLIDISMITKKNFDPSLFLILSSLNIRDNEIYAMFKAQKVDKTRIQFLSDEINLTFDLSRKTTGVSTFITSEYNSNSRYTNDYNSKTIKVNLADYIKTAQYIIEIEEPETALHSGNYPEPWMNGGITAEQTLENFLKIGWASRKRYESSLNLSQYYDFIELSTTFE